ncbi:hypothetical protein K469DRAFT_723874 [Zopfia rhizophila CBS 207.26]|uniref:Nicotinamide N-methyltransferase n=1 Tax=Zopfia rhizophila CBS 207.26 TaxID=1314779 RepID=A0A6A6DBI3_9PEZI|nr:hypothetical protein K469DRAFT_723874 [Zopfia rhizophila CBS 207.26]
MLPSLIALRRPPDQPPSAEDIFSSSLGGIFTDDLQNQHGDDLDTIIVYRSQKYGELEFRTADVSGEEQRRKFAHYLWNAGILMAELVGGRPRENESRHSGIFMQHHYEEDGWKDGKWWVGEEEDKLWNVQSETAMELGAGVGLAGIVCALSGAAEVTITDYPAPAIIDAITTNVSKNLTSDLRPRITIQGHQWGDFNTPFAQSNAKRYTRILAADCLWMPHEHHNLAHSMLHFLSPSPSARVFVIAGFHTGRAKVAAFFEEVVPETGLEIGEIYEMDADGKRREWAKERDGGREDVSGRKKWLVVAWLRRKAAS